MNLATSSTLKIIATLVFVGVASITYFVFNRGDRSTEKPVVAVAGVIDTDFSADTVSGDVRPGVKRTIVNNKGALPGFVPDGHIGEGEDNSGDTVRTLVATVNEYKKSLAKEVAAKEKLADQVEKLIKMEERLERKVLDNISGKVNARFSKNSATTNQRLSELGQQVETLSSRDLLNQDSTAVNSSLENIGIGKGDSVLLGGASPTENQPQQWIEPLRFQVASGSDSSGKGLLDRVFSDAGVGDDVYGLSKISAGYRENIEKVKVKEPAFTIPMNATLAGSVALTALVGRVPIGSKVVDPYPFKVLVGAENLMANGIFLPDIEGMIFSGFTSGDWTLGCVSGQIFSALFVFKDGHTVTYPYDGKPKRSVPIGWLSDQYGVPCVSGKRITNAYSFLAQRVGMAAAAGYFDARANAETTVTGNVFGGITDQVTGSKSSYAKNAAIGDGISESMNWMQERMAQSFDAIYVEPGRSVVLHIDQTLEIDLDNNGRMVKYASFNGSEQGELD